MEDAQHPKAQSIESEQRRLSSDDLLDALNSSMDFRFTQKPIEVENEFARREQLKNEDLAQDIQLKKGTLKILLRFLGGETIIIFAFALLQAWSLFGFKLEEWSFRILLGATITQTYLMLRIAVEYLFPKNK